MVKRLELALHHTTLWLYRASDQIVNLILIFSEAPLIVFVLDMTCILVQYRREVCKILEAACDYFLKSESNSHDSDEIVMASSPWKPTDEKHLHSAMHIYKCSANKFCKILQGNCGHIQKLGNRQTSNYIVQISKISAVGSHVWNCIHMKKMLQIMETFLRSSEPVWCVVQYINQVIIVVT